MENGAAEGERCALCKEAVNEGATRCKACGAIRRIERPEAPTTIGLLCLIFGIMALLAAGLIVMIGANTVAAVIAVAGALLIAVGASVLGSTNRTVVYWVADRHVR